MISHFMKKYNYFCTKMNFIMHAKYLLFKLCFYYRLNIHYRKSTVFAGQIFKTEFLFCFDVLWNWISGSLLLVSESICVSFICITRKEIIARYPNFVFRTYILLYDFATWKFLRRLVNKVQWQGTHERNWIHYVVFDKNYWQDILTS